MGCDSYGVTYNTYTHEGHLHQEGLTFWLSMESEPMGCLCTFPYNDMRDGIPVIDKSRLYELALLGAAVLNVYRERPPQSGSAWDDDGSSTRAFVPREIREAIGKAVGISVIHDEIHEE